MKRSFVRILCLLALSAAASTQAGDLRTVALTGQLVPTASEGDVSFGGFGAPALNDVGLTAFMGTFTNNIDFAGAGIWSEHAGGLLLSAAEAHQAPGMPAGFLFTTNGNLQLQGFSNAGTLFYGSAANNGGLGEELSGYWSERTGSPTPLALNGDQAPGAPIGIHFDGIPGGAVINNAGQSAFLAGISGGCPSCQGSSGIWSGRSGSLAPVALENQQAPGLPIGVNYAGWYYQPVINDLGRIAFVGGLSGSGVNNSNAAAIWSDGSGALAPVARAGDHAPGTPAGVNFFSLGAPEVNNAGKIVFESALTDDGVSSNRGSGIWTDRSGTLSPVAKSGDQAPGLPTGVVFAAYSFDAAINDANQLAFRADLNGNGVDDTNRHGIWSDASGSLALVARAGSQAPGLPTGNNFLGFGALSANDAGQIAFGASVSDGALQKGGIWATDRTGQLHLIAREGDQLEVAPGDFRTITALGYGLGNEGKSAFNSSGQLAFMAYFNDYINSTESYGVFVSNKVAGLPGDFNHDGTVDAADYIVWRKTGGSPADYNAWRTHFGQTYFTGSAAGSAAGSSSSSVPEPAALVSCLLATAALCLVPRLRVAAKNRC